MRKHIAAILSFVLVSALAPGRASALGVQSAERQYHVYAGTSKLSNDWNHTINIYASEESGEVWGDGTVSDPSSVDADGTPTRWLSYTFHDGDFDFIGSNGGVPLRASFGPEDVTWTQDSHGNWSAEIVAPDSDPQPLWWVVGLVVAVAVVLTGDEGCACGHNGGTQNHPGTNPPED